MQANLALIQASITLTLQCGEARRAGNSASITAIPDPAEVRRVRLACQKPHPDSLDRAAAMFSGLAIADASATVRLLLASYEGADTG